MSKLKYDTDSSRRRPKFKEAMVQIIEAHRDSPEEIASQMLNIGSADVSLRQNFQEIESPNVILAVDDFDGFKISLRSKIDHLKKEMFINPTQSKRTSLADYELILTTIDLKFAASVDDPDPDLALDLLERLLSELLPEATASQLLSNPEVVEVIAALAKYIGLEEMVTYDEELTRLVEAKLAEIREAAEGALDRVKVSSECK